MSVVEIIHQKNMKIARGDRISLFSYGFKGMIDSIKASENNPSLSKVYLTGGY